MDNPNPRRARLMLRRFRKEWQSQGNARSLLAGILAAGLLLVGITGCADRYPGPKSPQETIEDFEISDEFRVELFAAAPEVVDPVAMAFDKNGRAYVAEMLDYPFRPEEGEQQSRMRLLEDTDGDGRADESTVFADSLMEVTSIQPWKDGVLVTAAPDIIYLKDTDGDNTADLREIWFTGFYTGNSEAQITNLRFDIDNWIYAANTGRDGNVRYVGGGATMPEVSTAGGDFRFRLDDVRYERTAGYAQFGQDIDDWGHRFVTQNTLHVRNIVVPDGYMARNPHLSASPRENINDHGLRMYEQIATPYWREVRTQRRNERYDEKGLDRTEYARDHFTGASGATYYSAAAFPEDYRNNLFTGEVSGKLIHRDVIRPDGATFRASRAPSEQDTEFLISNDTWFVPASMAVGPDGMLYVTDMYRQHIESPYSIPEDLKEDMDFYAGDEMGRIYRIVPADSSGSYEPPRLGEATSQELVELLSHENRWWRLTAQRLLLERQDGSVTAQLEAMARTNAMPEARLHAFYALEGLDALDTDLIEDMLDDPHAGVREHGVRVGERYDELAGAIAGMVDDPSARVAFQVGLSLGEFSGSEVQSALVELARRRGDDEWIQTALLSSEIGSSVEMLESLAAEEFFDVPHDGRERLITRLAEVIGARQSPAEIERTLVLLKASNAVRPDYQTAALDGLAEGLPEAGDEEAVTLTRTTALDALLDSSSGAVRAAAQRVANRLTR